MNGETSGGFSKGNEAERKQHSGVKVKAEGMKSSSHKSLASPTGASPPKKIKVDGGHSQNSVIKRAPDGHSVPHKVPSSSSSKSSSGMAGKPAGSSQNSQKSLHGVPPVKIKKDSDPKHSGASMKSPSGTGQKPAVKSPSNSVHKSSLNSPSMKSLKPSESSLKSPKPTSDGKPKHEKSSSSLPQKPSSDAAVKSPSNHVPPVKIKKEPVGGTPSTSKPSSSSLKTPGSVPPVKIKKESADGKLSSSSSKTTSASSKHSSGSASSSNVPVIEKESLSPSKHVKKELKSPTKTDDDDDVPLAQRAKTKTPVVKQEGLAKKVETEIKQPEKKKIKKEDSDDDEPLSARIEKVKDKKGTPKVQGKRKKEEDESDDEFAPKAKTKKKDKQKEKEKSKSKIKGKDKDKGKVKKEEGKPKKKAKEEEQEVWKWWEEEPHPEGIKWITLQHNGPYFPPLYERLPKDVKFKYDGKPMVLSDGAEEVAGFYSRMLDHDYSKKDIFNDNFFEDWRKEMTDEERQTITSLKKCDFKEMAAYFQMKSEERKAMSKEQKQKIKEENEKIAEIYGFCMMDNHKQKVGNFKIEPPGLFRGRGDHPKQGKLKRRVQPEDVIINIGKEATPPDSPAGHKWKAIQHDNKVTWLACWVENIAGSYKYVMLNSATKLKGEKDWQKYETARKLKNCVEKIRANYREDLKSKEMRVRQRAVALYFIDKLALRAGHEKEEGETADTVGCCSLRVEHIKLHKELDDQEFVVEFDFLGKDSIRYQNKVPVDKRVFRNLQYFVEGKDGDDDLFDRLTTTSLNQHLKELMEGLTAKVFRTYNASITLQNQLKELTNDDDNVPGKMLSYNRANRAVAILCNHQRAAPKTFDKQMENLMNKIKDKKKAIKECKKEVKQLKEGKKDSKSASILDRKKNQIKRLEEQLFKLEVSMTDKEENKEIALGTSKLNYLDPRISVAWCKKNDVPIEKIYNKTQRQKFQWAIDMTEEDFEF